MCLMGNHPMVADAPLSDAERGTENILCKDSTNVFHWLQPRLCWSARSVAKICPAISRARVPLSAVPPARLWGVQWVKKKFLAALFGGLLGAGAGTLFCATTTKTPEKKK